MNRIRTAMRHISLAALLLACAVPAAAQTVYLPVRHPAYEFLDRIEARYGVAVMQFERPLPRMVVARALDSLARGAARLTPYDREQLAFYREEFAEELQRLHRSEAQDAPAADAPAADAQGGAARLFFCTAPDGERWHFAAVRGTRPVASYLVIDPVIAVAAARRENADDLFRRSNGIEAWGYAGYHLGAAMRWYDNGSKGIPYDRYASRTPVQGVVKGPGQASNWEYEVAEGQFTYATDWLDAGVQKMDVWQGSGRSGSLSLSDKAPSTPRIAFTVRLTDWLEIAYAHHWLFSDSLDFTRSYSNGVQPVRFYETKYLATHHLTARPLPNLQLTLGESIIYSGGDVNVLFLIPVLSFRAADRWTRATSGNSQFFGDLRYTPLRGVTLYGSGYIDELDYSKILASDKTYFNYHVAYTVGGLFTDLAWPLLRLASETQVEFTRVYPFVYTNGNPTQQYTSHSVVLGHWIGQNADLLTLRHTVHPLRSLAASLALSLSRFGNGSNGVYTAGGSVHQPAFLYDYEYSDASLTLTATWTPWHDLALRGWATSLSRRTGPKYHGAPDPEGLSIGVRAAYSAW